MAGTQGFVGPGVGVPGVGFPGFGLGGSRTLLIFLLIIFLFDFWG